MFGCFSVFLKSYGKWSEIKSGCYILYKAPAKKKKKIYKRAEKSSLAACEFEKHFRFHTQNKLWSDLKKLFGSYLLQLREAQRKEEVTESYFMGFSHSSRKLQRCCCLKPLEQGWHSSTLSSFHWLSQQLPIKRFRTLKPQGGRREAGTEDGRRRW